MYYVQDWEELFSPNTYVLCPEHAGTVCPYKILKKTPPWIAQIYTKLKQKSVETDFLAKIFRKLVARHLRKTECIHFILYPPPPLPLPPPARSYYFHVK